jgi:hypothetical protein
MFNSKYLTSNRQQTVKQLDKLHPKGIHGGIKFLTWFKEHVNSHLTSGLSVTCIMFNHLPYLIGLQCVLAGNVHAAYVSCRTDVLLPKVTIGMTSMGFASFESFLKLLTR